MKKAALYLFTALLILGLLPLIVAFAGMGLAALLGCTLSSAGPETCLVLGFDLGPTLTTMMLMHWLGLIGLPLSALGAVGLGITGLIHLIPRKRT